MVLKQFKCRVHSGIFKMPARRGRPPVQCTTEHPCSRRDDSGHVAVHAPTPATIAASAIKQERALVHSQAPALYTLSMKKAMTAKSQLEGVGWTVKGRAWVEENIPCAEVIATRGDEFLMIVWKNGNTVQQQYTMWNENNSRKLAPRRTLPFDPVELTDAELVEALRGTRVTWVNRIANSTEEAIIPDRLSIEHVYQGGREDPSMRIVKFCGVGSMFRAFHVGALLSIGSQ